MVDAKSSASNSKYFLRCPSEFRACLLFSDMVTHASFSTYLSVIVPAQGRDLPIVRSSARVGQGQLARRAPHGAVLLELRHCLVNRPAGEGKAASMSQSPERATRRIRNDAGPIGGDTEIRPIQVLVGPRPPPSSIVGSGTDRPRQGFLTGGLRPALISPRLFTLRPETNPISNLLGLDGHQKVWQGSAVELNAYTCSSSGGMSIAISVADCTTGDPAPICRGLEPRSLPTRSWRCITCAPLPDLPTSPTARLHASSASSEPAQISSCANIKAALAASSTRCFRVKMRMAAL